MAVQKFVEVVERMSGGKLQKVTITQYVGLATYVDKNKNDGKPFLAELATFIDYGPKQGVARCFTPPREEVSEEEKARNRELINDAAVMAMKARGIW